MAVKNRTKERVEGQLTGLVAEFFVAAELLKRGLQTSVTFGSAKAIDLLAMHPRTGKSFAIQVKGLRSRNYFPISAGRIQESCVYVVVVLNKPGTGPDFYIVPGVDLLSGAAKFGKWFRDPRFPGIHPDQVAD
jgi:hypothetical protein